MDVPPPARQPASPRPAQPRWRSALSAYSRLPARCGSAGWTVTKVLWRPAWTTAAAAAGAPGALLGLVRAATALPEAVRHGDEAFVAVHRTAQHVQDLLDELDEPVRDLVPGVVRAGKVLDDPVVDRLPEILQRLGETQASLTGMLAAAERVTGFAGDSGRLVGMPVATAASAFLRGLRTPRPVDTQMIVPAVDDPSADLDPGPA